MLALRGLHVAAERRGLRRQLALHQGEPWHGLARGPAASQVTVNNPSTALKRTDAANRWQARAFWEAPKRALQVTMTSKGYHQYFVTFPPATWRIAQGFG